jgi:putative spermidine/putrescine transport system substrate-binding protein
MRVLSRRQLLANGTAAAGVLAAPAIPRAQERVFVVGAPAQMSRVLERAIGPQLKSQTGFRLIIDGTNSLANLRKLEVQAKDPALSVVMMDEPIINIAQEKGLLVRLPLKDLHNVDQLVPGAVKDGGTYINYKAPCAAIPYYTKTSIGKIDSWADVWSPKYRGRVAMPAMTRSFAVFLIAVAAHLKTGLPFNKAQYEVDAAFAKLAELKQNLLVVYDSPPQGASLVSQGEAWIAPAMVSQFVVGLRKAGGSIDVAIPKEGTFALLNGIGMVKNGKNPEVAAQFVDLVLSKENQAVFVDAWNDSPANRQTTILPQMVPLNEMNTIDWAFVSRNRAKWIRRYQETFSA